MQKDGEDLKLLNVQFLSAAGKTEIPGQVSDAQCSTLVAVFIAITAHILWPSLSEQFAMKVCENPGGGVIL